MLVDKHRQGKPSIILIGGSNVAFGFNSRMIREASGLPVINTGLNAGFGLKFMLDHTSRYLTEGDILVIAPEYDNFFNGEAYGNVNLTFLLYIYPRIIFDLGAIQLKNVLVSFPGTKEYFLSAVLNILFRKENKAYSVSDFNEYGDYAKHWTMPSRPHPKAHLSDFKTIDTKFLDYYENAVAALRNRGIEVIIIPPSLSDISYNIIEERLTALLPELEKRNLNFSIPPQESAYPDSLFFDTLYHLGYEGILIRTNQLIELIRQLDCD
jgi:hypothetical protein